MATCHSNIGWELYHVLEIKRLIEQNLGRVVSFQVLYSR